MSVTLETTCIVSPLANEASLVDIESRLSSNSIIETEPSDIDRDETTTADAPEAYRAQALHQPARRGHARNPGVDVGGVGD